MAAKRRKIVMEDFDLGYGSTTIPTDSGGARVATKLPIEFSPANGVVYASFYGFSATATAAVNKAAISSAIAAISAVYTTGLCAGEVVLPRGTFAVAGDINVLTANVTIRGASPAIGYDGAAFPGTILRFTSGTVGFSLGTTGPSPAPTGTAGRYVTLRDMIVDGTNVLTDGIWCSGTFQIENVVARNCGKGIHFAEWCNQANLRNVTCAYNSEYGVLSDGTSNTVINLSYCNLRENGSALSDGVGLGVIAGVGLSADHCVIESNYGVGLFIKNQDDGANLSNFTFFKCWFENNDRNAATKYESRITSYNLTTAEPAVIHFIDCTFGANRACDVLAGQDIRFDYCTGSGAVYVAANPTNVRLSAGTNTLTIVNSGNTSNFKESARGWVTDSFTFGPVPVPSSTTGEAGAREIVTSDGVTRTSYSDITGAFSHLVFENPNGSVGNIVTNGSATAYNTSSDHRLKTDLKSLTGALERIMRLNVYDFEWIADKTRSRGVVAHELQAVIPQAVTGTKDAVDVDGKIVSQQVDYSKIVPDLITAIQELTRRVDRHE